MEVQEIKLRLKSKTSINSLFQLDQAWVITKIAELNLLVNYPWFSTLKIKSITAIAGAKAGSNNNTIVADLTIKGITKEITFPAQVIVAKDKVIANAEFAVDRTLFDVKYKGMADNLIEDTFKVNVRVVAKK